MKVIVTNDMWTRLDSFKMKDGDAFISADRKTLILFHVPIGIIPICAVTGLFIHGYTKASEFKNVLFRPCKVTLTVT